MSKSSRRAARARDKALHMAALDGEFFNELPTKDSCEWFTPEHEEHRTQEEYRNECGPHNEF